MKREEISLEVCTNNEAIREWCGLWYADQVEEISRDEAADFFHEELCRRIDKLGYERVNAEGQRSTCHGWHGANTFAWKSGPVGTFDDLTDEQKAEIEDAINAADEATAKEYAATAE